MSTPSSIPSTQDEIKRLWAEAEALYGRCSRVLFFSLMVVYAVKHVSDEQQSTKRREVAARLLGALRRLEEECVKAEKHLPQTLALFRAAFDPPCSVNGTPQHSYHEGVLYLARIDILGRSEEILLEMPEVSETAGLLGFHRHGLPATVKTRLEKPRRSRKPDDGDDADDGGPSDTDWFEWMMARGFRVRKHLEAIDIDMPALQCALDKEVAKVGVLLSGPTAPTPVPWSPPETLEHWARVFKVKKKDTATKLLREFEASGRARKLGGKWQVDWREIPMKEPDWPGVGDL